jgi:hypothetical protein
MNTGVLLVVGALAAGSAAKELAGAEVTNRYVAFLACEGVVVNSQRFPERVGPSYVIEIVKPVYWTGSKVLIDARSGAVKWEHSKKLECRAPVNQEKA